MGVEPVRAHAGGGGVRAAQVGAERFAPLPVAEREQPGAFSPLGAAQATGRLTLRPDSVVRR